MIYDNDTFIKMSRANKVIPLQTQGYNYLAVWKESENKTYTIKIGFTKNSNIRNRINQLNSRANGTLSKLYFAPSVVPRVDERHMCSMLTATILEHLGRNRDKYRVLKGEWAFGVNKKMTEKIINKIGSNYNIWELSAKGVKQ